jgi:hypothetical protein
MNTTPRWIPLFFGSVMILMAALILGALFGIVPTDGGQFFAPRLVIICLGTCLLAGGLILWIPEQSPVIFRSGLIFLALASLVIVCNWTAFAPDVIYSSSTSIGPFQFSSNDQVGGRIAFAIAAIVVNLFVLYVLVNWMRSLIHKK